MYNIPPTIRQETRASRTWLEVRNDNFLSKQIRDEITWDSHIGRVKKQKRTIITFAATPHVLFENSLHKKIRPFFVMIMNQTTVK